MCNRAICYCTSFVLLCITCSAHLQLYRALRAAAGKEEGTEASTTVTEHSIVDGLDNLQKYTLAAMQSEIDVLREELKKRGKVDDNCNCELILSIFICCMRMHY